MLLEGNRRFVENRGEYAAASQMDSTLLEELLERQKPYAAIIACSDSRTPPELLFDEGLGRLFVVRVAGSIIDASGVASVQYAVENAGAKMILVLGHNRCGAVTTVADAGNEILPGDLEVFQRLMVGLTGRFPQQPDEDRQDWISRLANENAILQARRLLRRCTTIRQKVRSGACGIAAARYDLKTGQVTVLGNGMIVPQ